VRLLCVSRCLGALVVVGLVAGCTGGSGDTTVPTNTTTETTVAAITTAAAPTTAAAVVTTAPIPVPAAPTTRTLNVPVDFATIQLAVDAAKPGDLVLIAAGTYAEGVSVRTPSIVVRGVDRNTVILDGGDTIENGILVAADNVAVENLTVRRYAVNGLLFTKAYDDEADATNHTVLQGYRASYISAVNNGLYGIYAFFARGGVIEHSYASGHSDSGFYVGQCKPCDAVLRDNVAELNAVGYEGTNASGNLWVVSSIWRRNRVGVTPNSQDMERLAPQGDTVIAGNLIEDNQDPGSPSAAQGGTGLGIAIGGGERNVIVRNLVRRNVNVGIFVTDLAKYQPTANEVRENVLEDNGIDLVLASSDGASSLPSRTNCFAGNTFTSSLPVTIETAASCAGPSGPGATDSPLASGPVSLKPGSPNVDYRTVPLPPPQPSMPNASSTDRQPASAESPVVDLASIALPKL
jgi:hypothetical protein